MSNTQYLKSEPGVFDEDEVNTEMAETDKSPNLRNYLKTSNHTEIEQFEQ